MYFLLKTGAGMIYILNAKDIVVVVISKGSLDLYYLADFSNLSLEISMILLGEALNVSSFFSLYKVNQCQCVLVALKTSVYPLQFSMGFREVNESASFLYVGL